MDYTQLTRDNFIHQWLIRQAPSPNYTLFQHIPLQEVDGARKQIFISLAEIIFLHHNDPDEFRRNLAALGYPEAAKEIDRRPHNPNIRKGNFGEILLSEYLHQYEGYQIPVYRLRKSIEDSPMPGEDVLAFKFGAADGSGRELLVGESKVRGQYSREVVEEAYQQLVDYGLRPHPKSFLLIVNILREQDRNDEADRVLKFLNKFDPHQPIRRNFILLITGNRPYDPFGWIQNHGNVIENLKVANVHFINLDDFVNALFEHEVEIDGA